MSKETLIQELRGYADDNECGLTVIQVEGIRKQIFRQLKPVEISPVQKIMVPEVKRDDSAKIWVAVLATVIAIKEIVMFL